MHAAPVLDAILDILNQHVEIDRDTGLARDRSRPADHHERVPARYHSLLDDWFLVWHGRPAAGATARALRGRATLDRLQAALAGTMPLVDLLLRDGHGERSGRWLACFHARVEAIRARATAEVVLDQLDAAAARRLASEPHAALARRLASAVTLPPARPTRDGTT
ncbi:MAG TPA: hypothetical protein VHE35_22940, partial [Kofleriaceae bacterium]|nr:hypothetical protein [Kofleriaceae bacterium]